MKTGLIVHGAASCQVDKSPALPEGILELSRLFVPEILRRSGLATKLLVAVCADSDRSKTPIALMIDKEKPLWLVNMYEKHGFEVIQSEPVCIMARRPKAKDER